MKTQTFLLTLGFLSVACGGGDDDTATPTTTPSPEVMFDEAAMLAALPTSEQLSMEVPGNVAKVNTTIGETSDFYEMTRNLANGVNNVVSNTLEMVANITSHPSTAQAENKRAWGPYTAELSPVTQLFVMEYVPADDNPARLEYALLWKAKDAADDTYAPVIQGRIDEWEGSYKAHGSFKIDYDLAASLDTSITGQGVGLFQYGTEEAGRVIGADLNGVMMSDGAPIDSEVQYLDYSASGGELRFHKEVDFTGEGDTALEDVNVYSRWQDGGAGRSDVSALGGDLESNVVNVSECWTPTFLASYNLQMVNGVVQSQNGDPLTCVFADADYPN